MENHTDSNVISQSAGAKNVGPYLAKVISHLDTTYMGVLEVQILKTVGGDDTEGELHKVKYISPFYGVTPQSKEEDNTYDASQKSYGMWFIPPDVGTTVLIIFIDGDPKRGYWIGCALDENMNFMLPGVASTKQFIEGGAAGPVAEYNKHVNSSEPNPTKRKKPVHKYLFKSLATQGLDKDQTRGLTSSSARREVPSMVFGISTPGPTDKAGPTGSIGKKEHVIPNAKISRLGGSTFVMDDGDDKLLRATKADQGPPEYKNIENGDLGGLKDVPHNELIRLRTRTGHQILLHNSEDLIYIGNSRGTAWIELSSDGKIDIFSEDSVSIRTNNDFNFTAKRDINFRAIEGNINLNADAGEFNMTVKKDYNITVGADGKLHVAGTNNVLVGGNHIETATQIHMNGPTAAAASPTPKINRTPTHEPWAGHENLNPVSFKADKTRATDSPTEPSPPADTFYDTFDVKAPTGEQK